MAKFAVNDKVSFINEKQDGIIKSIRPDGVCIVEIEDGFTIEALEKELVLIRAGNKDAAITEKKATTEIQPVNLTANLPVMTNGLWLVSVPAVSGMVTTGPADFYFVNKTSYYALLSVSFVNHNIYNGLDALLLLPGAEKKLFSLERSSAPEKGELFTQVLFHRNDVFRPEPSLRIKLPLLFPEITHAFAGLPSPYAFCRLQSVANPDDMMKNTSDLLAGYTAKDIENQMQTKKTVKKQPTGRSVSTVDLHIESITGNYTQLSSTEIISMQLSVFRKKLDEALLQRMHSVTFIHGAGNGILRSIIRKELSDLNLRFEDAPYEQFGGGATVVLFG